MSEAMSEQFIQHKLNTFFRYKIISQIYWALYQRKISFDSVAFLIQKFSLDGSMTLQIIFVKKV